MPRSEDYPTRSEDDMVGVVFDRNDPIDRQVIAFAHDLLHDSLPTLSEQKKLIYGVQSGQEIAMRQLVRSHIALAAVAIYPNRRCGIVKRDLLRLGTVSLTNAALRFPLGSNLEFNNQVVTETEADLVRASASAAPYFTATEGVPPMDKVVEFIGSAFAKRNVRKTNKKPGPEVTELVEVPETEEPLDTGLLGELRPEDIRVLRHLILPYKDMAATLGLAARSIEVVVKRAQRKTLADNATALVLALHYAGLKFEVIEPRRPLTDIFDETEMTIARMIHQPYKEIRETVRDGSNISRRICAMKEKSGARSLAELALMVRLYGPGRTEARA